MNILSAQGLTKSHGIKQLFSNLSFGIEDNDRVGLIGVNGSGKSTLLKVIAGAEPADGGQVTVRQGIRIEYAPQNPAFDPAHSVLDHIFASQSDLSSVLREYEELCSRLETEHSPELEARLSSAMARLDALNGWEYETRARTVLAKLGVTDLQALMGSLSGGYRKRVALARALLAEADLLILDEPTNHLDADTVSWLEEYLNRMSGALFLVTHDRYFLDRVTRRIVELDGGQLLPYEGNFSYYLERKAEQEAADVRTDERRRSILRKELEWLGRGARARRTKEKHRIDRVREMQASGPARKAADLKFEAGGRRLGSKIVEMENVS
jgi:ATP-binding cassette subfamily F protein uup